MRIKITAVTDKPCSIPYDYQYQLKSAIYNLFSKSDIDFSKFLHDEGYKFNQHYRFKMFTYSRFNFIPYHTNKDGFFLVKKINFLFSTAVNKNFEHLMYGIFPEAELKLKFREEIKFKIVNVEIINEPLFNDDQQNFICLSPIVVSTQKVIAGKKGKYYLNYFKPEETELWKQNLKKNLMKKYKTLNKKNISDDIDFEFSFDPDYVTSSKSKIKKTTRINNSFVTSLFAPFNLKCSHDLKKIAYDAGLGEQNSSGFGCIDLKQ
jgi:CRISPR-associated endoribonuclease Cas6